MAIDKIFNDASVDGIADNLFKSVSNSVSEVKAMQQRKAAENVQLVVQALKKIEGDLRQTNQEVANELATRIASIKDGKDGKDGSNAKDGRDGRPGRDGAKGDKGDRGLDGRNGIDGKDGISVTDAKIDFDGSLIITLSTGQEINVGEVVSPDLADKIQIISTMSTNGAVGIKDEGTSISTGVKNINFVGATVTATNSGDDVTVNVSAGTGDVVGPASATDTAVALFNGTTGKLIKNSPVTIGTTGNTVISGTDNTNAMLRITQLGTGNALLVEDATNPDATAFAIDSTGTVLVGNTTAQTLDGITPAYQQLGANNYTTMWLGRYSANSTANYIVLSKSRSATVGTNTIVNSGDDLGTLAFYGADGTNLISAASILGEVDGTPGTNDMPGRLVFSTTADGASSPTERMRLDNAGRLYLGTSSVSAAGINNRWNLTGSTTAYGQINAGTIQSDVTSNATGFYSNLSTVATAFTLTNLFHFRGEVGTLGAGSAITNQYGFYIGSGLTDATNNYGFYGNIPAATGRWNFYAAGTAENFFGGNTVISVTDNTNAALRITQLGTGNALLVEDETNPDSSPFVINNTGALLQGTTTYLFDGGASIPKLQSVSSGANNSRIRSIQHYGNSFGPQINFANAASSTIGDFTSVVTSGTTLGSTWFYGSDGVTLIQGAFIGAQVDGTAGANDMPGRLVFSTTADGASTVTERTRIDSAGRLRQFGTTIISNVDVLNATYDSVSFSVAAEELTPAGLFFSPDGSKMFVTGSSGDDVNEYVLSTPWVVSSATYSTVFSVSGQDGTPNGIFFRADGLKMYVVGATNDSVFQYALTSPWSVATASYESISFSVAVQETAPAGIFFKPDGLSMYITGNASDGVYQYTLSTAWNVSTATFLQTFSVSGQEATPQDLSFTGDGTRMFVIGTTGDDVNVYNLTTPWDISTATFVNSFSVAAQDTAPAALYIKPDGTKMYIAGQTNDTVYQYTVPSVEIQLTGTTAINGSATVAQDLTVNGNITGPTTLVANSTATALRITQTGTGNALLVEDSTNPDATPFVVDASGQVVRGYTTPIATVNYAGNAATPSLQNISTGTPGASFGAFLYSASSSQSPQFTFSRSASGTIGTPGAVAANYLLGAIGFNGDDGTSYIPAASIISAVDGTPGTNDMPGRLTFNTTSDGAATPTERVRIDSAGNVQVQTGAVMPYAPAPAGIAAATTLTNANIQTQIISATGTTYTITMPLGTTLETLATWATTGIAYDFYVINTASGIITMAVNTGVTSLGSLTIAIGASAHFRIRRTAASTFVLYRLN